MRGLRAYRKSACAALQLQAHYVSTDAILIWRRENISMPNSRRSRSDARTIIESSYRLLWRVLAAALIIGLFGAPDGRASDAVWRTLEDGGHVILIRHAIAPGIGDPAGFILGDCATQRNLSAQGRAQAKRIGATLRARKIQIDRVLSSRWCRALETARLMDLGPVESFAPLDSFFANSAQGPAQTVAVKTLLQDLGDRTIVMVTHQVNITALTGIYPQSGEMIIVKPAADASDALVVVGRVALD
jgi:phosphohistidine phosphatase SixA